MGEEKMSMYLSTTLSTYFYYVGEPFLRVMDVAMIFPLLWEWMRKKRNFPIWEIILLHCLAEIKEMMVSGATYGILYNLLTREIIAVQGLETYTHDTSIVWLT